MSYTIQMASKISGVGVHTIRAWEKRYKALEPNRDSAGHRVYTKSDIEKLMFLSELCLLGYTISKVAKLSIEELKALLTDLGKNPAHTSPQEFHLIKEKVQIDPDQSRTILFFALKAFKLDVINQELGKIKSSITPRAMALDYLVPLMKEVRALSLSGMITSSQEESAINLLRFHGGYALYKSNENIERYPSNVVVSGLDQEENSLYSVVAGLLCNHYGYSLNYLGSNVSLEVLGETLKFLTPDLLILSGTTAFKSAGKTHLENFLEKLQKGFKGEMILFGKTDMDREDFSVKKISRIQTADALDAFLAEKRNLNL